MCMQASYFEGDQVSVVICPTITVLYHISGNFLTAPRIHKHGPQTSPSQIMWPSCGLKFFSPVLNHL